MMATLPTTLIHNDFNPKNIAFKMQSNNLQPCIFDWQVARLHLPQVDLIELLAFTLPKDTDKTTFTHYVELHRTYLEHYSNTRIDITVWQQGLKFAIYDYLIRRYLVYVVTHVGLQYKFLDALTDNLKKMISFQIIE